MKNRRRSPPRPGEERKGKGRSSTSTDGLKELILREHKNNSGSFLFDQE